MPNTPGCIANPNPTPVPTTLGGTWIHRPVCAGVPTEAIASLFSYDDVSCHQANSVITAGARSLKFIEDVADYLPPNYREEARRGDFHGSFYCDTTSNTFIMASRGSVSLTALNRNDVLDWYETNLAQHLGDLPLQYKVSQDVVWLIEDHWIHGRFDGICGSGSPDFLLTGHSKGGGQAQFAAARNNVKAVVFNSDPVNELIFSDWLSSPDAPEIVRLMLRIGRGIRSLLQCRQGQIDGELARYIATGNIRDVRMVNDVIVKYLLPYCSLPHAPIEWLADTLSCSTGGVFTGHSIETVVRELQVCPP